ncbi:MAG: NAD(P)H-dependent oxidoreductase subunit E [Ignavibacteria bacterium]|nr:NAD(P)H-dependent oxidoreductase subunit E [Ignavibacteria bacterium]
MNKENYIPVFDDNEMKMVEHHKSKYPAQMAAVMPLLWMIQEKYGWISVDAMRYVGDLLKLPHDHVLGWRLSTQCILKNQRVNIICRYVQMYPVCFAADMKYSITFRISSALKTKRSLQTGCFQSKKWNVSEAALPLRCCR